MTYTNVIYHIVLLNLDYIYCLLLNYENKLRRISCKIGEFSSEVRKREMGNDNVVKKKERAGKVPAFGGAGMEGAPARAVAKRRPLRDPEVGRQIRSFTYHFATREIRDKHGPFSPRVD